LCTSIAGFSNWSVFLTVILYMSHLCQLWFSIEFSWNKAVRGDGAGCTNGTRLDNV